MLFRIFQEALTNVVRHAQRQRRARHARRAATATFELRISDNGRGITDAQVADPRAIGLLGMRERAALIGGAFTIAGAPGKGTAISSACRSRSAEADDAGSSRPAADDADSAGRRSSGRAARHPHDPRPSGSKARSSARPATPSQRAVAGPRAPNGMSCVADISLPGTSGLDLIKELRRLHPALPTLVVSMHPAAQFARRALSAGAAGYLTKDSAPEEFVAAIEEARRGRRYVGRDSGDDAAPLVDASRSSTPHEALSDREYQVLRMLGSGQTVSDIARDLGPEREDGQHVPHARAREARHADQRRADALRDRERAARLVDSRSRPQRHAGRRR